MKKINLLFVLIILLGTFFRFYNIDKNPPGLYIDEASIGYNAYKILQTGQDEYGISHPIFFKSFGDYKMPGYIYATALSMEMFGKNEFAIRFPSAFFGVLTIILFYFFINKLFEKNKSLASFNAHQRVSLLATLLLATSSWHIHFSRGGFEVNMALFFFLLACYLSLLFWEKQKVRFFLGAAIAFIVAVYTYHTYRILVPLTWTILVVWYYLKLVQSRKKIILIALIFILLSLPLFRFSFTPEGSSRFAQTSAFSEYKANSPQEKIIAYPMVFLRNYISFYSSGFLFDQGDGNGRHQVSGMGLLYRWQLPFLLIGVFWLLKQKRSTLKYSILGLLIIAPFAASIVRPSPHSLRALLLVIPFTTIIACGIVTTYNVIKNKKKIFIILISAVAVFEFSFYLHGYYVHYPHINALDWGAGYKNTVLKAQRMNNQYKRIVIDNKLDFATVYFNFYAPTLHPIFVDDRWVKPKEWEGDILYIRPYYGNINEPKVIDQIYLPGEDKTIFAQFWKL